MKSEIKILIIVDEYAAIINELVLLFMLRKNFLGIGARSIEEAKDLYAKHQYDLVILDDEVKMKDTAELLQLFKNKETVLIRSNDKIFISYANSLGFQQTFERDPNLTLFPFSPLCKKIEEISEME